MENFEQANIDDGNDANARAAAAGQEGVGGRTIEAADARQAMAGAIEHLDANWRAVFRRTSTTAGDVASSVHHRDQDQHQHQQASMPQYDRGSTRIPTATLTCLLKHLSATLLQNYQFSFCLLYTSPSPRDRG